MRESGAGPALPAWRRTAANRPREFSHSGRACRESECPLQPSRRQLLNAHAGIACASSSAMVPGDRSSCASSASRSLTSTSRRFRRPVRDWRGGDGRRVWQRQRRRWSWGGGGRSHGRRPVAQSGPLVARPPMQRDAHLGRSDADEHRKALRTKAGRRHVKRVQAAWQLERRRTGSIGHATRGAGGDRGAGDRDGVRGDVHDDRAGECRLCLCRSRSDEQARRRKDGEPEQRRRTQSNRDP